MLHAIIPIASMGAPWKSRAAVVAALAVLVALATVVMWTERAPFPLLNDDVAYLSGACGMARLDALEWGPGYAALYCGLTRAVADPFAAFWMKQAAVLLAVGVLLAAVGRRFGLGPMVAALSGLWCVLALLSPNGTLEFAFLLGLVACVCAASDTALGWSGFFVCMGLAFLVRTEYVVGLLAALALLSWRARTRVDQRFAAAVGALVLAACLVLAWGRVPGPGGRSWFAFGQQFAVNYAEAHPSDADPLVDWQRIATRSFPTSGSIAQAARENPRMFAWHLGHNLGVRLPRALVRLLLPVPSFAAWPSPWNVALGLVAVVAVLAAGLRGARDTRSRADGRLAPLLALAVIPVVSLAFRPQARHLLPLVPLLVVLCGRGLAAPPGRSRSALTAALAGLLVAGAIAPWVSWTRTPLATPSLADRLREERHEERTKPLRVLASWYGDRVCALVGPPCEAIAPSAPHGDVVLIDDAWAARPEVQAADGLRAFVADPARFGCRADPPVDGIRFVRCP